MNEDLKSLQQKQQSQGTGTADWLETMPEPIREWLGSESLLYLIIDLNKRLGFEGIKSAVVPDLLLQIALREVSPKDIASKLAKALSVGPDMAFKITKEIEEKMLRPIEVPLRKDLDVDIKEIYTQGPVGAPATPTIKPPVPMYRPQPPIAPPTLPIPSRPPVVQASPEPVRPAPTATPKPATPINPPSANEVPVKINVTKPGNPNPFGDDSWINKLK